MSAEPAEFLPAGERPRVHAQRIVEQLREANRRRKSHGSRALTKSESEEFLANGLDVVPPSMHEWVSDYVRSHFQLAAARRAK